MILSSRLKKIREDLEYIRKAQDARVASARETERSKAIAEICDRLPINDVCLLGQIARRQKKRLEAAREAGNNMKLGLLPEDRVIIEEISQRAQDAFN